MAGKPYQSSLIPYEAKIIALRRKRPPVSYSQIAALLREEHQITISKVGVYEFIRHRAKYNSKTCKIALDYKLSETGAQPAIKAEVAEKPTALPKQTGKPKQPEEELDVSQLPEIKYSDTYNLTRLSDEEAAKWQKYIKERNKR
jgi:hypothetical protein